MDVFAYRVKRSSALPIALELSDDSADSTRVIELLTLDPARTIARRLNVLADEVEAEQNGPQVGGSESE